MIRGPKAPSSATTYPASHGYGTVPGEIPAFGNNRHRPSVEPLFATPSRHRLSGVQCLSPAFILVAL